MNRDQALAEACAREYNRCVERFLLELGITEEELSRCEIRCYKDQGLDGEIWYNQVKVGEIKVHFETGDKYRFVVDCVAVPL